MDKFTNIMNELTTIFTSNANSTIKIKQEKFLVNNFSFYGILTSKRKPIVKPVITNCNKILTLQEKKILFEKMYKQPNREFQYTAIEFLKFWWKKNLTFNDLNWLLPIIKYNIWWDTTDYFDDIFGVLIFSNDDVKVRNEYLFKLINDENDWIKRIAIQSQLMFKIKTDIDLLLTLIKPLLVTNNFYLIRSIGWALRNAALINPTKINQFIKENNVSKKIISVINEH
ncbi:DNA alkylation repair protein [Spiroplasma endosymbiont of Nebria brevicollis]|uniref:DNA alkylation repair protein n=1 Tax=Spiroplasma endosymbiont of Nebria brevicollis TaxID=3066284 RepID=UPI00313E012D